MQNNNFLSVKYKYYSTNHDVVNYFSWVSSVETAQTFLWKTLGWELLEFRVT